MPRFENRVRRLERRRRDAEFDPRQVCLIALDCYEQDQPLPANLDARESSLAEAMLDFLIRSEPDRQFGLLPLPRPP